MRDLLINAQRDIQALRQGVTDQLSEKSEQVARRDKEIERLKQQVAGLEAKLREANKDAQVLFCLFCVLFVLCFVYFFFFFSVILSNVQLSLLLSMNIF